jgi:hypothetical protein
MQFGRKKNQKGSNLNQMLDNQATQESMRFDEQ